MSLDPRLMLHSILERLAATKQSASPFIHLSMSDVFPIRLSYHPRFVVEPETAIQYAKSPFPAAVFLECGLAVFLGPP